MSCLQSVEYRNYETLSRLTFQQIGRRIWLIHTSVWAFTDHGCNLWMKGASLKAWKIILNIASFKTCCFFPEYVLMLFERKGVHLLCFLQTVTNKYYVFATNKGKHSRSLGGRGRVYNMYVYIYISEYIYICMYVWVCVCMCGDMVMSPIVVVKPNFTCIR